MRIIAVVLLALLPLSSVAQEGSAGDAFRQALAAQAQGQLTQARALAAPLGQVGRDLLLWERLRDLPAAGAEPVDQAASGRPVPLPDLGAVADLLTRRADWPGVAQLRGRVEVRVLPGASQAEVLAFFAEVQPTTALGAETLYHALMNTGRGDAARDMLRGLWREARLSGPEEEVLLARYGDLLEPLILQRAERAFARRRASVVRRMLPLLSEDQRAVMAVRLAYLEGQDGAAALQATLPAELRDAPLVAAARFDWLTGDGEFTDAVALLAQYSQSAETLGAPEAWVRRRPRLARWVMRNGNPTLAYALAAHHFTDAERRPSTVADLEWIAGYIALRYLSAPDLAAEHFRTMGQIVVTPISRARSWYWQGEALMQADQPFAARVAFRIAAQYQVAFYGQMAAARLGEELDPRLVARAPAAGAAPDDMITALDLLYAAGARSDARQFAKAIGASRDLDVARAGAALALAREDWTGALWLGKAAARRGIVIPEALFPDHPLGEETLPVSSALALSIARQESEFRVDAGSSVGALGLMQLMPGTAQDMARATGRPYNRAALYLSWEYNGALGAAYLAYLAEMFGQSPVLIAVGYNAGPGRVRSWVDARGDPRLPGVDPVDWIEHIPFDETRNYVMRVTEALPIYLARTGATPHSLPEILQGALPRSRPVMRPQGFRDGAVTQP